MDIFKSKMAEFLEVDSVELTDEFESFDSWDSLTRLSIIAFCDSEYNITLLSEEIEKSQTIQGLKELIQRKIDE